MKATAALALAMPLVLGPASTLPARAEEWTGTPARLARTEEGVLAREPKSGTWAAAAGS